MCELSTGGEEALTLALQVAGSEDGHNRDGHRALATDIIATLHTAGFVVVPREATETGVNIARYRALASRLQLTGAEMGELVELGLAFCAMIEAQGHGTKSLTGERQNASKRLDR